MRSSTAPTHPGFELRQGPAGEIEVTELARILGVSRITLSRLLNGQQAISPTMAIRLETWLGGGEGVTAEDFLTRQMHYDLWHARREAAAKPDTRRPRR